MRIRVIQRPSAASIDGLDLGRFEPGHVYDVGTSLGCLMLCEGWAEPVVAELPEPFVPLPETELAPIEADSTVAPAVQTSNERAPTNLVRDTAPPFVEVLDIAAEFHRRRSRR